MDLDTAVAQLAAYSRRHTGQKAQFAGVAAKYLGLRKEFGRVYDGMLADPLLKEIIGEAALTTACGWRPPPDTKARAAIYCDGCCLSNGRAEARAGYGIHVVDPSGVLFSNGFRLDSSEPQTNQRAELTALLYALNYASENTRNSYTIYSDSRYGIDCITRWADGWAAAGWRKSDKKPVLHSDLIISCYTLYKELGDRVVLEFIEAHTGFNDAHSRGNAIADRLAREGALKSE